MADYPEATAADFERDDTAVLLRVHTRNVVTGQVVVAETKQVSLAVLREWLNGDPDSPMPTSRAPVVE